MKTIAEVDDFSLPESRKSEPVKTGYCLRFCSISNPGYQHSYLQITSDNSTVCVLLGQQVTKAVRNAMNTVRGCLKIVNTLDTFDKAPTSYSDQQTMGVRNGEQVMISSTDLPTFIKITVPPSSSPGPIEFIVRGEEVLAAIQNVTRN